MHFIELILKNKDNDVFLYVGQCSSFTGTQDISQLFWTYLPFSTDFFFEYFYYLILYSIPFCSSLVLLYKSIFFEIVCLIHKSSNLSVIWIIWSIPAIVVGWHNIIPQSTYIYFIIWLCSFDLLLYSYSPNPSRFWFSGCLGVHSYTGNNNNNNT